MLHAQPKLDLAGDREHPEDCLKIYLDPVTASNPVFAQHKYMMIIIVLMS